MHECRPSSSFVPENKGTDVIPSPGPVSHPLVQLVYFGLPCMQRAVPTSPGDHIPQKTTIPQTPQKAFQAGSAQMPEERQF